jgi:hypothetical protein
VPELNPIPPRSAPSRGSGSPLRALTLLAVIAASLAGCGEDPFFLRWAENPREVLLYSLERDELNRPTAFDMASGARIVVESATAAGQWDFALDTREGEMVFLPPRSLGVQSRAAMFPIPGATFSEVREAPSDTTVYISRDPVPVRMGTVYVVRTRQQPGSFGEICTYYGKVQPLEIDVEAGILRFLFDTNPVCSDPALVPPGA